MIFEAKRALAALEKIGKPERKVWKDVAKTHHKVAVRKAAIYCLGDSDDPHALQALIEIIRNKN